MKIHTDSTGLRLREHSGHLIGKYFFPWAYASFVLTCEEEHYHTSDAVWVSVRPYCPRVVLSSQCSQLRWWIPTIFPEQVDPLLSSKKGAQNRPPNSAPVFLSDTLSYASSLWRVSLAWHDLKFKKFKDSTGSSRDPTLAMLTVKSPVLIGLENSHPILLSHVKMIPSEVVPFFLKNIWR